MLMLVCNHKNILCTNVYTYKNMYDGHTDKKADFIPTHEEA